MIIATDANILINFIHVGRLDLLGALPGKAFTVPIPVVREIRDSAQAAVLQKALRAEHLGQADLTGPDELEYYANLCRTLGKGESACLALARHRGWSIASDEKRLFRRTAIAELGEAGVTTTPELMVQAIHAGLATVDEADAWKALLARHRFVMKFDSFSDLLGNASE